MSAKKLKPIKINLLPKDPFASSQVGHYLEWALSTGRYIVIITQVVVVMTFFQRFSLDRQLSDLNEEIFRQQQVVQSLSQTEARARAIQSKAEFIDVLERRVNLVEVFDFLNSSAPSDLIFENLSVANNRFNLTGVSFSDSSLENFTNTIKEYDGVLDVVLNSFVQVSGTGTFEFNLTIVFEDDNTTS